MPSADKQSLTKNSDAQHRVFHSMGIPVHLTIVGSGYSADSAADAAQKVFDAWDKRCSRFREDSELCSLNNKAGETVQVSKELLDVLSACKKLAQETIGVFDPSVGSYLAAAGYGLPAGYSLPKKVPTFRDIKIDFRNSTVQCAPGQVLEPAALVKGLALDQAGAEVSRLYQSWMINAGGDILAHGSFGKQEFWNVAIQHPSNPAAVASVVRVRDQAVATSGTYQTKWEWQGEFWQHQIDTKVQKPSQGVKSLTVVAKDAVTADMFSSVGLLYGIDRGQKYLESLHVPYMFMDDQLKVYKNDSFKNIEVSVSSVVNQ